MYLANHHDTVLLVTCFFFTYRFQEYKLLAATDSGDIEVWVAEQSGNVFKSFGLLSSCHNDMVLCVDVSTDSDNAISGGADGRCVL